MVQPNMLLVRATDLQISHGIPDDSETFLLLSPPTLPLLLQGQAGVHFSCLPIQRGTGRGGRWRGEFQGREGGRWGCERREFEDWRRGEGWRRRRGGGGYYKSFMVPVLLPEGVLMLLLLGLLAG